MQKKNNPHLILYKQAQCKILLGEDKELDIQEFININKHKALKNNVTINKN